MKITVLLFGILKDIIERNSIELIVEEGVNIEYLKGLILKNHGKLIDYTASRIPTYVYQMVGFRRSNLQVSSSELSDLGFPCGSRISGTLDR